MDQSHGGNSLGDSVRFAFAQFSRARQAVARVFVPSLDLYPDGGVSLEDVTVTAAAVISPAKQVTFICDGYLVGISCSVQSGLAADLASTKLALVVNGSTNVITAAQQGQGFATFWQLNQPGGAAGIFRLMAPIRQSLPYSAFIKYEGGQTSVTADLTFWYVNTKTPPLTD